MFAYTPVEFNCLQIQAKTFILPARQTQFIQDNILTKAPVHPVAVAMNTNTAFSELYSENIFWYQEFSLKNFRRLRGGQLIVDLDAADKYCSYVTTLNSMNFQDDIPSIPIDNFKDHFVLLFDLTAMLDATERCS